ncbi:UvrD-helicase domain-containing protein [Agrobacterium radiobacter]|uniref:UvrD-helicase domain-containing protein n=1 Tax=Agrobacterium radiobacter TaxID=362 RepID=UPI003F86470C
MTSLNQRKETEADKLVRACLQAKQSFAMIAGAGSGKTSSLVEAIHFLRETQSGYLRKHGQKIACITYTNRAVDVISGRLEFDKLVEVTTLHGFLWAQIKRFSINIRQALIAHVVPNHIENKRKDAVGNSKKAIAARERIASLEKDLEILATVPSFHYNETNFSDYAEGLLSHDDIVSTAAYLIATNANLRKAIGQRFPYIFIDEAQDTFPHVVEAINKLCEGDGLPIVGYFGDPMQQIYEKRAGSFNGPNGSAVISKSENFRCATDVIDLLNAFRKDIQQSPAGPNTNVKGSVRIKLVKAEDPLGERKRYTEEQIGRALAVMDGALEEWGWANDASIKQLYLVRQVIARRLGFSGLHTLFTGDYASSRAEDEYEKGEHFLIKPFVASLVELIDAKRSKNQRQVFDILRKNSPAFDPRGANSKRKLGDMLASANSITDELLKEWDAGDIRGVLAFCHKHEVCLISDRLKHHMERRPRDEPFDADKHQQEKGDWLADALLAMKTAELKPYVDFTKENTPLSTQHGVKGDEFKNVFVMFDDVGAGWSHYSFTKSLTPKTSGAPTEGQLEKSTKLAYVCFSRAEENLRILLFTADPVAAANELVELKLFREDQIEVVR